MNKQIGSLLLVGGLIGAGYLAFNKITSSELPYKMVCKITQEIKHQILIVSISFAEGAKQHYEKLKRGNPDKTNELTDYFRNKMCDIYSQKQDLILGKYGIDKEKYSASLSKYANDKKLSKLQKQIIDMMEKSILGEVPDLTVDEMIVKTFGKTEMRNIYEDMSKMILYALLTKLQEEKQKDRYFDSNSDDQFKKVIRELGIYDKKIEFFKSKGFKQEWGCPNQNFFKHSEGLKLQDPEFRTEMRKLETIYERVVDIAAKDPLSLNIYRINEYYVEKPQPIIKQVEDPEVPEQSYMNLQASTKSEPEHEQKKQAEKIEQVRQEAHEAPAKNQISEEVSKPEAHIQYVDVPSDAHELQKELHENPVEPEQKQEPEPEAESNREQPEVADSNASLDAVPLEVEPEQVEPEQVSEQVEPEHVEPEHVEPEHVEPEHVEPEHVEPEHVEPQNVEAHQAPIQVAENQEKKQEEVVQNH